MKYSFHHCCVDCFFCKLSTDFVFKAVLVVHMQAVFAGSTFDLKNDAIFQDINTDVGKAECCLIEIMALIYFF